MKTMKKAYSLLLCVLILCTVLPVTTAFAAEKVIIDDNGYSAAGALDDWTITGSDYITYDTTGDTLNFRAKPYSSAGTAQVFEAVRELAVLDKDTANATVTRMQAWSGKYRLELDVDFDTTRTNADWTVDNYYQLKLGYMSGSTFKPFYTVVLRKNAAAGKEYFNPGTGTLGAWLNPDLSTYTLRFDIDTDACTLNFYVNGVLKGNADDAIDATANAGAVLSAFSLVSFERGEQTNPYFKISDTRLTELEQSTADERVTKVQAAMAALPKKLAEDVTAVTGNLTLPTELEGCTVTWSSSEATVIADDGTVTRDMADKDVTLTAKVAYKGSYTNALAYTRDYAMTVKRDDLYDSMKLIFDEKYTSSAALEDWTFSVPSMEGGSTSKMVVDGGALKFDVRGTNGYNADGSFNNTAAFNATKNINAVIKQDDVNRTAITQDGFSGVYLLELDLEYSIESNAVYTEGTAAGSPKDALFVMYLSCFDKTHSSNLGDILELRFSSEYGVNIPHEKKGFTSVMKKTEAGKRHTLGFMLDTVNERYDVFVDGTKVYAALDFNAAALNMSTFSGLRVLAQNVAKDGSYLKLYNTKLTEVKANADDNRNTVGTSLINSLPDKLMDNVDSVTENFTLPTLTGGSVSWESGNRTVVDKTGKVTRWYEDVDTYLKGAVTISSDNQDIKREIVYAKKYNFTVKEIDNLDKKLLFENSFSDSSPMEFWEDRNTGDDLDGEYSIEGGKLKLKKITEGQTGVKTETPSYSLVRRLAFVEQAYDDTTRAEVFGVDNSGAYDLEFDITPYVSGDRPFTFSLGNQNDITGVFKSYAMVKVDSTGMYLYTGNEPKLYFTENVVSGQKYIIKLRVDTVSKTLWPFFNGTVAAPEGLSYATNNSAAEGIINAFKVYLDANSALGDYVTMSKLTFHQLYRNAGNETAELIAALGTLTADSIAASPDTVTADALSALPANAGGFNIEWSSSVEGLIDIASGTIYHPATDTTVKLTAKIVSDAADIPVSIYKVFHLNVKAAQTAGQTLAYQVNKEMTSLLAGGAFDDIRYDIDLPTSLAGGIACSWVSSKPGIISDTGALNYNVTIPQAEGVTFTAVFTDSDGNSITKTISGTVAKRGKNKTVFTRTAPTEETLYISDSGVNNIKMTADSFVTAEVQKSGNGSLKYLDSEGNKAFEICFEGNEYYFVYPGSDPVRYSMNNGETKTFKLLFMFDLKKITLWADDVLVLDRVNMNQSVKDFAALQTASAKVTVNRFRIDTDEFGIIKLNLDNIDYFGALPKATLRHNLTLKTDSVFGARLQWQSGNTAVLGHDGALTVSDSFANVALTYTISDKDNADVFETRTMSYIVPSRSGINLALSSTVSASTLAMTSNPLSYINDEDSETACILLGRSETKTVTFDLGAVKAFNTMFIDSDCSDGAYTYSIECSDNQKDWTVCASGDMTNTMYNLAKFDVSSARYVRFNISSNPAKNISINDIGIYLLTTAEELTAIEINSISLPSDAVSANLTLPIAGTYGTPIGWRSSNPEIITAAGVVNRPQYDTTVVLTAYAVGNEAYTKQFNMYVLGINGAQGAVNAPAGGSSAGFAASGSTSGKEDSTITTPGTQTNTDFNDVPKEMWAYESIKQLKEKGIISGDGTNNFHPDEKVSREQFLKMLLISLNIELKKAENRFDDVDEEAWYAAYVLTAADLGITNGADDKLFGIGEAILRQDMCVLLKRALEYSGINTDDLDEQVFADDAGISDYAKLAVYAMKKMGIVQGSENAFYPQNELSKAEAATVIKALIDILAAV